MANRQLNSKVLLLHENAFNNLMCLDKPESCLAIAMFFLKCAKIQGTNKIFCNNSFIMKGLNMGRERVEKCMRILREGAFISTSRMPYSKTSWRGKQIVELHYIMSARSETTIANQMLQKWEEDRMKDFEQVEEDKHYSIESIQPGKETLPVKKLYPTTTLKISVDMDTENQCGVSTLKNKHKCLKLSNLNINALSKERITKCLNTLEQDSNDFSVPTRILSSLEKPTMDILKRKNYEDDWIKGFSIWKKNNLSTDDRITTDELSEKFDE